MSIFQTTKKITRVVQNEFHSSLNDFNEKRGAYLALSVILLFCFAPAGYCDVDQTLRNILSTFTQKIIPTAAIFGLIWAGLSCAAGNPAGRSRLILVIFGAVICFGATSIVNFIRGIVS